MNEDLAVTMVTATEPSLSERARRLSEQLKLPYCDNAAAAGSDVETRFLLTVTPQRLELRQPGKGAPGPIYTDFIGGSNAHRRQFGGGRNQPLARAVGLKSGYNPVVLDATAGLGRDAFVLAYLGCTMLLAERNPIVAALLEDGLQRGLDDHLVGSIIEQRMQLHNSDARQLMTTLEQRPDVIYLDPMYPARSKSASVKKEMRSLQQIVGHNDDGAELLENAIKWAKKRVVVKRPCSAEPLTERKPSFEIRSKKTRYDIYAAPHKDSP